VIRDLLNSIKDGLCMGLGVTVMFLTVGICMYEAVRAFMWVVENVSLN